MLCSLKDFGKKNVFQKSLEKLTVTGQGNTFYSCAFMALSKVLSGLYGCTKAMLTLPRLEIT